MAKMTLIICLLSFITISSAYKHGESCSYDSECDGLMICPSKSYRCGCKAVYGFNEESSNCTSFNSYRCQSDYQCQDSDSFRVCNQSQCVCKDKYRQLSDKLCTRIKVGHLESCDKDQDCKGQLYCYPKKNTCICKQGYLWSKTNDDCRSFDSYECAQDSDCQDRDPNRICNKKDDKCVCRDGYEATHSTDICTKAVNSYNESCNQDNECEKKLKCYDVGFGNKKCQWEPGYLWTIIWGEGGNCLSMNSLTCYEDLKCQDRDKNRLCLEYHCKCRPGYMVNYKDMCERKYAYREACTHSTLYDSCQSNLTCSNGSCLCTSGYIWSDKEHKCKPFQDGNCTMDLQCQDQDKQRTCDVRKGKCVCKQRMFEDNKNMCSKLIALGLPCNNTNECVTTNSICHKTTYDAPSGLCVCKPTHLRSGKLCLAHACIHNSDCYSDIFDKDDHLICDGNGQCNCQTGYTDDLVEGQCKYNTSTLNNQLGKSDHKPILIGIFIPLTLIALFVGGFIYYRKYKLIHMNRMTSVIFKKDDQTITVGTSNSVYEDRIHEQNI